MDEAGAQVLDALARDLEIGEVLLLGQVRVICEDALLNHQSEVEPNVLVFFDPVAGRGHEAEFKLAAFFKC